MVPLYSSPTAAFITPWLSAWPATGRAECCHALSVPAEQSSLNGWMSPCAGATLRGATHITFMAVQIALPHTCPAPPCPALPRPACSTDDSELMSAPMDIQPGHQQEVFFSEETIKQQPPELSNPTGAR